MNKRILAGFHDSDLVEACNDISKINGYSVDFASDDKDMLEKANKTKYGVYLMDANLGTPNSEDVTPVVRMYNSIKLRLVKEKGEVKFLAISSNQKAVEKLKKMGIPAQEKKEFNLVSFLS